MAAGEPESLESVLVHHSTGIDVLLAPPTPEMAELITTDYVRKVVQRLRDSHDLVVVDSWPWFHDTTLSLLDMSDQILALLTLEITNIKSIRLFLEVASQLGYSEDKVKLVLNRADSAYGIRVADVEHSIGRKIDHTVVSDGRTVVYALNRGVPFVASNRQAQVSQDVVRLAKAVVGERVIPSVAVADASPQRKSLFAWR
jgi:pilus assembly protein CpaE